MKRIFDSTAVLAALFLFGLPMLLVSLLVKLTSPGPVLCWADRVGVDNQIFKMPKFRMMRIDTPAVATHLLNDPDAYLTPIDPFLRKSRLDELPQLWSVLKGDMSFEGPRPALFNQDSSCQFLHSLDKMLKSLLCCPNQVLNFSVGWGVE